LFFPIGRTQDVEGLFGLSHHRRGWINRNGDRDGFLLPRKPARQCVEFAAAIEPQAIDGLLQAPLILSCPGWHRPPEGPVLDASRERHPHGPQFDLTLDQVEMRAASPAAGNHARQRQVHFEPAHGREPLSRLARGARIEQNTASFQPPSPLKCSPRLG
jgi:hypothetical protein